jgi:hypothetical protein
VVKYKQIAFKGWVRGRQNRADNGRGKLLSHSLQTRIKLILYSGAWVQRPIRSISRNLKNSKQVHSQVRVMQLDFI